MRGYKEINRQILRLSIPAIVSNIAVPVLGIFDTGISGHLGSSDFLASIALATVMLNVIFWLFGFLRAGTTGLTAVALGRKDDREIRRIFSRSLLIGLAAGLIMILIRKPLNEVLSLIAGVSLELEDKVRSYFFIRIWGAPALLATMAVSGWFVGMQSTVYPLIISVGMNVLNIGLSLFLVYGNGLGFEGIAWGTTLSNYLGAGLALVCCLVFNRGKRLFATLGEILKGGGWNKYFGVNINLFIRSFCITAVSLGVTKAGSQIGVTALGVNVVVMQLFLFFSFFMDGFAFSGEALVGLYFGMNNRADFNKSVKSLLMWTLGMSLFFMILTKV